VILRRRAIVIGIAVEQADVARRCGKA
jgi:hypothetical protein